LYEHLNGKLAAMDVSSRVSKFDHYPRLARMLRTVEEHLDTHEPLEVSERAFLEEALPKLLEDVDRELAELEWWLGRVNWLESQVRAEDYPPGRGMPDAAFDESRKHMTLKELCEAGELSWPAECVREVYGAVV
jgi:hypothetical protein